MGSSYRFSPISTSGTQDALSRVSTDSARLSCTETDHDSHSSSRHHDLRRLSAKRSQNFRRQDHKSHERDTKAVPVSSTLCASEDTFGVYTMGFRPATALGEQSKDDLIEEESGLTLVPSVLELINDKTVCDGNSTQIHSTCKKVWSILLVHSLSCSAFFPAEPRIVE